MIMKIGKKSMLIIKWFQILFSNFLFIYLFIYFFGSGGGGGHWSVAMYLTTLRHKYLLMSIVQKS